MVGANAGWLSLETISQCDGTAQAGGAAGFHLEQADVAFPGGVDAMTAPYDGARVAFIAASFNWLAQDFILVAWTGTPVFVATERTIAEFKARGGVEVGRSLLYAGKVVDIKGVARSGPVVIPGISADTNVTHFTLVKPHPTIPDNGELQVFIDDVEGVPFIANGLDVMVQPDWVQDQGWFRA